MSRPNLRRMPKIPNPFASRTQARTQPTTTGQAAQTHTRRRADQFVPYTDSLSDDQLIQYAVNRKYLEEDKLVLLHCLSGIVENTNRTKYNRYTAAIQIAKLLGSDETIYMHGADRQANYFAGYAIDLMLQEMDNSFSKDIEKSFRETLKLWIHDLAPEQEKFNLDGIIRMRDELNTILFDEHFFDGANTSAAWRNTLKMEDTLVNQLTESVSTEAVRDRGAQVLAKMEAKIPVRQKLHLAPCILDIKKQCRALITDTRRLENAFAGLEKLSENDNVDNNWSVKRSPASILPVVWAYVQTTTDDTLRGNLMEAFFNKLVEVKVESPCVVGQLQRLLDVPTGLDPDMDQFGAAAQMGDELSTIASKVYERFDKLIEEDATVSRSRNEEQLASPVGRMGKLLFRQRVEQDVGRFRGINVRQLEADIQRLEAGFELLDDAPQNANVSNEDWLYLWSDLGIPPSLQPSSPREMSAEEAKAIINLLLTKNSDGLSHLADQDSSQIFGRVGMPK
ncbi:MAG: hypothetical protein QE278_10780 [Limnobacter sp.]|nr:hypothetical protein [Limnobacter sp.]